PRLAGRGKLFNLLDTASSRKAGNLEFALITFLNGLGYGFLLFLLSSGLTLIYSMMGVPNFAHASFYMLGAYVAYALAGVLG
ncbi:ABC transporter permease subunit, partial [Salmonella enterica]|uniref:ABC transporter permease subunit n=1 Tax=Salmonella enterica TaxID=28901 RepID=UPI003CF8859A